MDLNIEFAEGFFENLSLTSEIDEVPTSTTIPPPALQAEPVAQNPMMPFLPIPAFQVPTLNPLASLLSDIKNLESHLSSLSSDVSNMYENIQYPTPISPKDRFSQTLNNSRCA
jgi:hypothetical protein